MAQLVTIEHGIDKRDKLCRGFTNGGFRDRGVKVKRGGIYRRRFLAVSFFYSERRFFSTGSTLFLLECDYPEGTHLTQDVATPILRGLIDLHQDISFFLLVILFFVFWLVSSSIVCHSSNSSVSCRRTRLATHHDVLEVVWTAIPSLVMLCVAVPSFALLYSVDEILGSALTVKTTGRQWYWNYEYNLDSLDSAGAGDKKEVAQYIDSDSGKGDKASGPGVEPDSGIVKWEPRNTRPEYLRFDESMQRYIKLGVYLPTPKELIDAGSWLNDWFYDFSNATYFNNYGAIEQYVRAVQVFRTCPGPQTLSLDELHEYQKEKISPLFRIFEWHRVTQENATKFIADGIGVDVMAQALLADREAWERLYQFLRAWADGLQGSSSQGGGQGTVLLDTLNISKAGFDSYMLASEDVPRHLRLLAVDRPVSLPSWTFVRFLVTASDVLHSWAVPSFGVKVDACPGRLNQTVVFASRLGEFFGQCSEICGINHGFMPIHLNITGDHDFFNFALDENLRRELVAFAPKGEKKFPKMAGRERPYVIPQCMPIDFTKLFFGCVAAGAVGAAGAIVAYKWSGMGMSRRMLDPARFQADRGGVDHQHLDPVVANLDQPVQVLTTAAERLKENWFIYKQTFGPGQNLSFGPELDLPGWTMKVIGSERPVFPPITKAWSHFQERVTSHFGGSGTGFSGASSGSSDSAGEAAAHIMTAAPEFAARAAAAATAAILTAAEHVAGSSDGSFLTIGLQMAANPEVVQTITTAITSTMSSMAASAPELPPVLGETASTITSTVASTTSELSPQVAELTNQMLSQCRLWLIRTLRLGRQCSMLLNNDGAAVAVVQEQLFWVYRNIHAFIKVAVDMRETMIDWSEFNRRLGQALQSVYDREQELRGMLQRIERFDPTIKRRWLEEMLRRYPGFMEIYARYARFQ